MAVFGQYLLRMTVAAIVCGVVKQFLGGKEGRGVVIDFVTGVIMVLVVLQPLTGLQLNKSDILWNSYTEMADQAAETGKKLASEELSQCIKERTSTYILDKAAALKADIKVEVTLSEEKVPVPVAIVITGNVSPHTKSMLSETIAEDLGIAKENQIWNCV